VIARPALLAALLLVAAPTVHAGADPCDLSVSYAPGTGAGLVAVSCSAEAGPLGGVTLGTSMQLPNPILGGVTLRNDGSGLQVTSTLVGWTCTPPGLQPVVTCLPPEGKSYTCYGLYVAASLLSTTGHARGSATCHASDDQVVATNPVGLDQGRPADFAVGSQWSTGAVHSLVCSAVDPNHPGGTTPGYAVTCGDNPAAAVPPRWVDPGAVVPIHHT
jgi:hypothetical protein